MSGQKDKNGGQGTHLSRHFMQWKIQRVTKIYQTIASRNQKKTTISYSYPPSEENDYRVSESRPEGHQNPSSLARGKCWILDTKNGLNQETDGI